MSCNSCHWRLCRIFTYKKNANKSYYRQEYINSHEEETKELNEIIDRYIKDAKWCYGR